MNTIIDLYLDGFKNYDSDFSGLIYLAIMFHYLLYPAFKASDSLMSAYESSQAAAEFFARRLRPEELRRCGEVIVLPCTDGVPTKREQEAWVAYCYDNNKMIWILYVFFAICYVMK